MKITTIAFFVVDTAIVAYVLQQLASLVSIWK